MEHTAETVVSKNITFLSNSLGFSTGFVVYFCSSFNRVLQLCVGLPCLKHLCAFHSKVCFVKVLAGFLLKCMPNPLQRTFTDLFNYWVLFCLNIVVFVTNCYWPPYLKYIAQTLVDTWILCWGSLISLLVSYL